MPRITAPSLVEHRARQREKLLAAGRKMLLEHGLEALTMASVGEAAGLARNSLYEYFSDRDDLVASLVEAEFPRWRAAIDRAMESHNDSKEQVAAYITTQLEWVSRGEHRIALALADRPLPTPVRTRFRQLHVLLTEPLVDALHRLGALNADRTAALLQGIVNAATTRIENGDDPPAVIADAVRVALSGV